MTDMSVQYWRQALIAGAVFVLMASSFAWNLPIPTFGASSRDVVGRIGAVCLQALVLAQVLRLALAMSHRHRASRRVLIWSLVVLGSVTLITHAIAQALWCTRWMENLVHTWRDVRVAGLPSPDRDLAERQTRALRWALVATIPASAVASLLYASVSTGVCAVVVLGRGQDHDTVEATEPD